MPQVYDRVDAVVRLGTTNPFGASGRGMSQGEYCYTNELPESENKHEHKSNHEAHGTGVTVLIVVLFAANVAVMVVRTRYLLRHLVAGAILRLHLLRYAVVSVTRDDFSHLPATGLTANRLPSQPPHADHPASDDEYQIPPAPRPVAHSSRLAKRAPPDGVSRGKKGKQVLVVELPERERISDDEVLTRDQGARPDNERVQVASVTVEAAAVTNGTPAAVSTNEEKLAQSDVREMGWLVGLQHAIRSQLVATVEKFAQNVAAALPALVPTQPPVSAPTLTLDHSPIASSTATAPRVWSTSIPITPISPVPSHKSTPALVIPVPEPASDPLPTLEPELVPIVANGPDSILASVSVLPVEPDLQPPVVVADPAPAGAPAPAVDLVPDCDRASEPAPTPEAQVGQTEGGASKDEVSNADAEVHEPVAPIEEDCGRPEEGTHEGGVMEDSATAGQFADPASVPPADSASISPSDPSPNPSAVPAPDAAASPSPSPVSAQDPAVVPAHGEPDSTLAPGQTSEAALGAARAPGLDASTTPTPTPAPAPVELHDGPESAPVLAIVPPSTPALALEGESGAEPASNPVAALGSASGVAGNELPAQTAQVEDRIPAANQADEMGSGGRLDTHQVEVAGEVEKPGVQVAETPSDNQTENGVGATERSGVISSEKEQAGVALVSADVEMKGDLEPMAEPAEEQVNTSGVIAPTLASELLILRFPPPVKVLIPPL
ncbi:hypothetical protein FRC06_004454, partial [Ceratobasidium sp. 370]